jgi:hypothetical protein
MEELIDLLIEYWMYSQKRFALASASCFPGVKVCV